MLARQRRKQMILTLGVFFTTLISLVAARINPFPLTHGDFEVHTELDEKDSNPLVLTA